MGQSGRGTQILKYLKFNEKLKCNYQNLWDVEVILRGKVILQNVYIRKEERSKDSVNAIYHVNRLKKKSIWQIQYPFIHTISSKLETEGNVFSWGRTSTNKANSWYHTVIVRN